jgi:lipopolysaccharide export LptBFGC system permease protein LptF
MMSWTRAFRLSLYMLPLALRRKHAEAMEALFARELQRARERGRLEATLAGAAGVWDVIRRGAYEQLRPGWRRSAAGEHREHSPSESWSIDAHGPRQAGANLGGPHMPQYTTRQLLRRHAVLFTIAFLALTLSMLALFARKQLPMLSTRGASGDTIMTVLLLAIPFIAAMTIPMAVFVAVLREFTRFRADGTLAVALRERDGIRRLVRPVLLAAIGIAVLELVVTAQIVPRANARLAAVMATGSTTPRSDRMMTIGELREAERSVRAETEPDAITRIVAYEVEVQKKLALAVACVVMALAGVVIALRIRRGGMWLVVGASCVVFWGYYVLMVAGESLADRLLVSPFVGMWLANALLLAAALMLAAWRRRGPLAPSGGEAVAVRG